MVHKFLVVSVLNGNFCFDGFSFHLDVKHLYKTATRNFWFPATNYTEYDHVGKLYFYFSRKESFSSNGQYIHDIDTIYIAQSILHIFRRIWFFKV